MLGFLYSICITRRQKQKESTNILVFRKDILWEILSVPIRYKNFFTGSLAMLHIILPLLFVTSYGLILSSWLCTAL